MAVVGVGTAAADIEVAAGIAAATVAAGKRTDLLPLAVVVVVVVAVAVVAVVQM